MSDQRVRNRNNLIIIACDAGGEFLTVVKRCGKRLQGMGVPQPNGDHFLYPEEGVYLLEACCAMLTINRIPITLSDAYFILHQKNVPWYKYFTYTTLKRAGWIALRPRRNVIPANECSIKSIEKECSLLDSFPTVHGNELSMPQLHLATHLVPPGVEMSPIVPSGEVLGFTKVVNKPCRPNRWPIFPSSVTEATSWKEYTSKKVDFLFRKKQKSRDTATNLHSDYDYDVYLPNTYTFSSPSEPAFRIICTHAGGPNFDCRSYMQKYSSFSNMVIAIVDQGKVNFVNTSFQPINLFVS